MVLFETRDLCKEYRHRRRAAVRAVDGVSLTIERGSCTVLTGPSGSGKTTLLALLGALERPSRGQVLFEGRDLTLLSDVGLARLRRRFGFVFQDFALIDALPVWENVIYPLIPRGVTAGRRREIAERVLAQVGMIERFGALPRELSGGEQQRTAIARALAGEPEVLFADEPTSNLDRDSAHAVVDLLRAIQQRGTTLVLSTHDVELRALGTAVYTLDAGRIRGNVATD
jgi:putative ABC transport system ATP-binding protein